MDELDRAKMICERGERISNWLDAKVPHELFHYTSLEGLLGIIGRRELWASKAIFTNDAREFKLALHMAQELLHNVAVDVQEDLLASLKRIAAVNVCISSFSSKKDLLSQWRGYCPPGSGYSLGFDGALLSRLGMRSDVFFYPGRCIYEPEFQREMIADLMDAVICRRRNPQTTGWRPSQVHEIPLMDFGTALCFIAPLLKDKSFKEESEWRLITVPVSTLDAHFSFRPGRSYLLPFYRIPLAHGSSAIPLRRLMIGPTPHPALAEDAVCSFLGSQGLGSSCVVEHWTIP